MHLHQCTIVTPAGQLQADEIDRQIRHGQY